MRKVADEWGPMPKWPNTATSMDKSLWALLWLRCRGVVSDGEKAKIVHRLRKWQERGGQP